MGVTVVTSDATLKVNTSQRVVAPVGWDDQVAEYGRGYNYPKPTGQTTVFRTGDDADIEATIFAPIRVANSLKVQNSLVDFLTLGNTNSFGNLDKNTDSVGGQIYGAGNGSLTDYVIDNYTGLGWFRIPRTGVGFDNNIDAALALTLAGFDDWFVASIKQNTSLDNYANVSLKVYAPFTSFTGGLLTSTTKPGASTICMFTPQTTNNHVDETPKTSTVNYIICRKHF